MTAVGCEVVLPTQRLLRITHLDKSILAEIGADILAMVLTGEIAREDYALFSECEDVTTNKTHDSGYKQNAYALMDRLAETHPDLNHYDPKVLLGYLLLFIDIAFEYVEWMYRMYFNGKKPKLLSCYKDIKSVGGDLVARYDLTSLEDIDEYSTSSIVRV